MSVQTRAYAQRGQNFAEKRPTGVLRLPWLWCAAETHGKGVQFEDDCVVKLRDEGRALGTGFQEQVSNHSKLLRLRAVVVSVGGKAQGRPRAGEHPRDER